MASYKKKNICNNIYIVSTYTFLPSLVALFWVSISDDILWWESEDWWTSLSPLTFWFSLKFCFSLETFLLTLSSFLSFTSPLFVDELDVFTFLPWLRVLKLISGSFNVEAWEPECVLGFRSWSTWGRKTLSVVGLLLIVITVTPFS